MNFASLIESYGDKTVLALGGLIIGALFGFFAQRSKFCLRSATLEFWHRSFGKKVAVWLLAFSSAVVGVQWLILSGHMDAASTRQISATGSISGALVGGLLFGAGMVMTRGCASRLLVLSANGNLRALLSGLIFAVTAQAALGGVLSPLARKHQQLVDGRRRVGARPAGADPQRALGWPCVWPGLAGGRALLCRAQRLWPVGMGGRNRHRPGRCRGLGIQLLGVEKLI